MCGIHSGLPRMCRIVSRRSVVASARTSRRGERSKAECNRRRCNLLVRLRRAQWKPDATNKANTPHEEPLISAGLAPVGFTTHRLHPASGARILGAQALPPKRIPDFGGPKREGRRLELAYNAPLLHAREISPRVDIDVTGDKSDCPVAHRDVDATGMLTA